MFAVSELRGRRFEEAYQDRPATLIVAHLVANFRRQAAAIDDAA